MLIETYAKKAGDFLSKRYLSVLSEPTIPLPKSGLKKKSAA